MALHAVLSFFYVRWTLSSKDVWDSMIASGNKEVRRGRGMRGKKVLLELSVNSTRGEMSFDRK